MVISLNFKMTPVAEPTRTGSWDFLYWVNAANDNEWYFDTDTVTSNITLKDMWTQDTVYIVTFVTGTGGSTVLPQNRTLNELAHEPDVPTTTATTTTLPTTAGLYRGTGASDPVAMAQVFVEWRAPGGTSAFDFNNTPITANIELIAQWTTTRISTVTANDVAAAVTYINNADNPDGAYTLLLSANSSVASTRTLNRANRQLTIIGLDAERILRLNTSGAGTIFNLSNGASLTLGDKITLQGGSSTFGGSTLVIVQANSTLTMLGGSKITGNILAYNNTSDSGATAAIDLRASSSFIMEGGEITNNHVRRAGTNSGGVLVAATATFTMSGGTISGNSIGRSSEPSELEQMDVRFVTFNAANHTKTGGTIGASNRTTFQGTGPGT